MTMLTEFELLEESMDMLIHQFKQLQLENYRLQKQLTETLKTQRSLEQKNQLAQAELKRLAGDLQERLL